MTKILIISILSISFGYGQATNTTKSETELKRETVINRDLNYESGLMIEGAPKEEVIDKNGIYAAVGIEVPPEYPGGWNTFIEDFNKEFKLKVDQDLKGRIFLEFVVETDGTLSDIKLIRDLGFGAGKEAIRALRALSKWKPGIHKGKPLRVRHMLPVGIDIKANTDFNQFKPAAHKKNIPELLDKN